MADLFSTNPENVVQTKAPRFTANQPLPNTMLLALNITDRDTITELAQRGDGEDRDEYALQALRIGVLALRQARGQLDADLIQRESRQMLGALATQLQSHAQQVQQQLSGALKDYFDPQSGRFHERVERLIKQDGDLEQLLRRQIGGTDSELCKTLVAHVGDRSPLMKLLSPDESQGLMKSLRDTLEFQLTQQRDRVLKEFSLDNKEGALSRLVSELVTSHGTLNGQLQERIDLVVKEFSLNEENSALSRLVRNVNDAQRTISREFSLDNDQSALSRMRSMLETTNQAIHRNLTLDDETSALARLKRELLGILDTHGKTNQEFQEEVKIALAKMVARREEAERSTRHGLVFEDAVGEILQQRSQQRGDQFDRTGNNTGLIKNCKIGDFVIELGPDCSAAGARVVIEAKEVAGYTLAEARKEIEKGRENREAQVGLFILSQKSAPAGLDAFMRHGNDVFVVWDAEDCSTDLYLQAGLEMARALCVRAGKQTAAQAADFSAIDAAILEIDKRSASLEDITKWSETIRNNSDKILDHIRKARNSLERQIEVLQERIQDLRQSVQLSSPE
ncbi:MAG: hypothetical protein SGJ20_14635 [Planctomycetota bacterium]|nr:hypothetical protein [Planctomycetota bacterium]